MFPLVEQRESAERWAEELGARMEPFSFPSTHRAWRDTSRSMAERLGMKRSWLGAFGRVGRRGGEDVGVFGAGVVWSEEGMESKEEEGL